MTSSSIAVLSPAPFPEGSSELDETGREKLAHLASLPAAMNIPEKLLGEIRVYFVDKVTEATAVYFSTLIGLSSRPRFLPVHKGMQVEEIFSAAEKLAEEDGFSVVFQQPARHTLLVEYLTCQFTDKCSGISSSHGPGEGHIVSRYETIPFSKKRATRFSAVA